MDSIVGRNILNCSFRYKISLDNIISLHFQPRDIYSYYRTNEDSSALLSLLFELLQCRNGSCNVEMVQVCEAVNLVWWTYRR